MGGATVFLHLLVPVEERPVLLVDIQESWCSLFIAKSSVLTPASTLDSTLKSLALRAKPEEKLSLG